MSIDYLPPSSSFRLAATRRRTWGALFGRFIRSAREMKCRSVEEATRLAGMETSEWKAIEAGQVPSTRGELDSIAAALEMGGDQMGRLVWLCRGAWGR